MPELPEVETMRRGLEKKLLGKKIQDIEVRLPTIFQGDIESVVGEEFVAFQRFGKALVMQLSNDHSIAAHVKMTGQFVYKETKGTEKEVKNFHPKLGVGSELPNKWTHVIFTFFDGSKLFYNDIRKFGWLKVLPTKDVHSLSFFSSLGPDPLSNLSVKKFYTILQSSSAPVKNFLMNQQKIAGVGNIYANDALFLSRIDPRRSAKSLSEEEGKRLFEAVQAVLKKGIAYGGASEINYINVEGGKGSYQDHFLVYGKEDEACSRCQNPIRRIVQAGRSTFFCPVCQT